MIEIYVQVGLAAELYTTLRVWNESQKMMCQRLSNRRKAEVRAIRNEKVVARFLPHRVECSEGC